MCSVCASRGGLFVTGRVTLVAAFYGFKRCLGSPGYWFGGVVGGEGLEVKVIKKNDSTFVKTVRHHTTFVSGRVRLIYKYFDMSPRVSGDSNLSCFLPRSQVCDACRRVFRRRVALPRKREVSFIAVIAPGH